MRRATKELAGTAAAVLVANAVGRVRLDPATGRSSGSLDRVVQGGFYGWPIANGNRAPGPDFGKGQEARIAASIPPVHPFRAHNAPLRITLLRGDGVPAQYRGAGVAALHGSWNRTRKDGYKVVSQHWGSDGRIAEKDFLTRGVPARAAPVRGKA